MKKSIVKKSTKAKLPSKTRRVAKVEASLFYAQSKRLRFRLLEPSDEALYCDLFTDAKAMAYVVPPLSRERAELSFKKALEVTQQKPLKQQISVIVERATKKAIGITSLKLVDVTKRRGEGGILLKPAASAQRYAAECVAALPKEVRMGVVLDTSKIGQLTDMKPVDAALRAILGL